MVADRPNIILVTLDDARVDDMRFMPNVQRLIVRAGTEFSEASVSYPLCCPSRASILTGQYAHNHGLLHNKYPAGSYRKWVETGVNRSTFPVWLQQSGYHTVMVGKFLNGYEDYARRHDGPKDPGWSSWKATVNTYNYRNLAIRHRPGDLVSYQGQYGTDMLSDIAVRVVDRQASSPDPFFLWLSYVAPHGGAPPQPDDPAPLPTPNVADRDRGTFAHLGDVRSPAFDEADVASKPSHIRELPRIDTDLAARIRQVRKQRVESLQAVDRGIGRLVDALRRTGQLDNTVVIFTSDHGFSLGEHRRPHGKMLPYREVLSVPLYIRGPGFPSGRVLTQRVSMSIDIAPTILDLAGVAAPHELDGVSLCDMVRNPSPDTRTLLVEAWRPNGSPLYAGLRTSQYLYVEYPATGEVELYDMLRDPHQLYSRHDDAEYLTTRHELAAELAETRDHRSD